MTYTYALRWSCSLYHFWREQFKCHPDMLDKHLVELWEIYSNNGRFWIPTAFWHRKKNILTLEIKGATDKSKLLEPGRIWWANAKAWRNWTYLKNNFISFGTKMVVKWPTISPFSLQHPPFYGSQEEYTTQKREKVKGPRKRKGDGQEKIRNG